MVTLVILRWDGGISWDRSVRVFYGDFKKLEKLKVGACGVAKRNGTATPYPGTLDSASSSGSDALRWKAEPS
jgi:hypothetical protein